MISLREQLLPLRKEVARGQGYFVPYLELEQLLTEDEIRECLSQFECLRGNERDVFRFTSLIRETSMKVFAILVSNGDEAHILDFLYRRETDLKLPYNEEGLYFLPRLAASSFLDRQSQFDPVILEVGVIHRTLRSKDVLPFVFEEEKAEGGFGKVWRVETLFDCQKLFPVAADSRKGRTLSLLFPCLTGKQIVTFARKELQRRESASNERHILDLLRTLSHPHIVEFLGSYAHHDVHNLLFPYIETDLQQFLRIDPSMDRSQCYTQMFGLADALSKIHHFSYRDKTIDISHIGYHHDLRPANILVKNNVFMIADFGLSRMRADNQDSRTRLKGGHDDYLGPEAFNELDWTNGMVGRSLDVWALGCIYAELASFLQRRSVDEFRNARRATHGAITDNAFHLNCQIRPSVSRWLAGLVECSNDRNMSSLVDLVREKMLIGSQDKRIRIRDVADELYDLSCRSMMEDVDNLYAGLSYNGKDRKGNIHILILLEQKRYVVWRSAVEHLTSPLDNRLHTNLATLRDALTSAGASISSSELPRSDGLLETLWAAVDSLYGISHPKESERLEIQWNQEVCEIKDVETLAAIRAAPKPQRYKSVGVNVAMRYMAQVISQSIRIGGRSRYMDAGCVDIDKPDVSGTSLIEDRSRTMGHYTGANGKVRILIEWKEYDVSWQEEHGTELKETMDTLVNLLDPEVTPRKGVNKERVLNCVGYFHQQLNRRFGFVYSLNSLGTVGDTMSMRLYSCNNVIRMTDPTEYPESIRPDLGAIFQLAKDLASCLLAFHIAGWFHKNISSHSVLVFAPTPESVHEHVASAVLAGFNDSRPEASGVTLGPRQELEHYYHPLYRYGERFKQTFDYFSLGIVLLELGLWYPISSLRKDHADIGGEEEFRQKLLKSYVPQLGEKMGALYRDAVEFCLDAEEQLGKEHKGRAMHDLFKENVEEPLCLCYA